MNEMKVTITNRGIVQIDNAELIFKNFSGRGSMYNREGDRNFCIRIREQEIVDALLDEGFNVKIREPKEEGGDPFMYLKVNVKFHPKNSDLARLNPEAYLINDRGRRIELDEESICMYDDIDILKVDLDLSGSNWAVNGREGRSAYLKKIYVTQEADRFAHRYAEEESPADDDYAPFE